MIVAPSEHEVLIFLAQLAILISSAHLLGGVARRLGQPSVVGELVAGIVLGPSLLGEISPTFSEWLFPAEAVQGAMIVAVGWLGVMLLLVGAGAETDLHVLRSLGRAAALVSTASLVVPLAIGIAFGFVLPATLRGPGIERWLFALFLGTAMAISALPVIAKVLAELGLLRRNVGQLTLATATINDVVGWLLLGVVAGMAGEEGADARSILVTLCGVIVLVALSMTVGQRIVDTSLRAARTSHDPSVSGAAVVVLLALGLGMTTQALGVESVLGAFVAGVVIGRSHFRDETALRLVEVATRTVFAPVFLRHRRVAR